MRQKSGWRISNQYNPLPWNYRPNPATAIKLQHLLTQLSRHTKCESLAALTDRQLLEQVKNTAIFSRIRPQDKLRIVREAAACTERGEVQARFNGNLIPPNVYEVGIEIFRTEDRGKGFGSGAIWELMRLLFDEEGAERVQGSTDVENPAMRGATMTPPKTPPRRPRR